MTTFVYKARTSTGQLEEGDIEAQTRLEAAEKLMAQGYLPSIVKEKSASFDLSGLLRLQEYIEKVDISDLILFTSQMGTLFHAGIPLVQCFDSLIEQADKAKFKRILGEVKRKVEDGTPMNEAMKEYPELFSETFTNMIMAGEVSGTLDESLIRLTRMLESQFETENRLKEVTRYPKIIAGAVTIAVSVLLVFVVPRFIGIFESAKLELPMPTKILILIEHVFRNYWYIGLAAAGSAFFLFKKYIGTSIGRYQWHRLILSIPVIGEIFTKVAWSQFADVMANLVKSGVPLLEAINVGGKAAGNDYLMTIFKSVEDSVREGTGMAEPLAEFKMVPPIVIQMIAAGENAGALDEMLEKVAVYFNEEADRKIKQLSALVEPALLFVMGGIVLFISLAIFMPMWDMTKMAGK